MTVVSSIHDDRAQRRSAVGDLVRRLRACSDDRATDKQLRTELVLVNLGVAEAMAARYRDRGLAQDDLVQVACEALTKAVQRFDPNRGSDLLSYAVPVIRGEIQRHFRDFGWMVRPPRSIQELQGHINRTVNELEGELNREPSAAEVCSRLDISEDRYNEAITAFGSFAPKSLDRPVSETTSVTIGEVLASDCRGHENCEDRMVVDGVLRSLSPLDRRLIDLRFFQQWSQRRIGEELDMSQVQVSRQLRQVLDRLRASLGSLDDGAGTTAGAA